MSYDVYLRAPDCDKCGREGESTDGHNYTSNMSGAWCAAGAPLHLMHGSTGEECIPVLENAIARVEQNVDDFKKFEPSNGWGHVDTMLDFLRRVLADCREHPARKLWVSR